MFWHLVPQAFFTAYLGGGYCRLRSRCRTEPRASMSHRQSVTPSQNRRQFRYPFTIKFIK